MLLRSKGEDRLKGYCGFVSSPLKDALMVPDTVLIYGDGVQITHMIQALCYDYKQIVHSFFEGFGETLFKSWFTAFRA